MKLEEGDYVYTACSYWYFLFKVLSIDKEEEKIYIGVIRTDHGREFDYCTFDSNMYECIKFVSKSMEEILDYMMVDRL